MAGLKITDLATAQSLAESDFMVVDDSVDTMKSPLSALRDFFVGSLASLTTTAKTSIVAAINELAGKADNKCLFLTSIACSATTGNFATLSNAAITADHIVTEVVWANPSAITTEVTWTTAAGSLTLNGTCETATTATITLVKKDN